MTDIADTTASLATLPLLAPESVRRVTLPNGLTVLVRADHSAPVVAIVTYVKAGYFDETDDVVGIAHVLEHMYFKGTARRGVGEISKQTKAAGGYLNAHTIYDHTSYYVVLPSAGFEQGLEIQADAYANSVIAAEELARELEVIIQEAKRKTDNPSAVAVETLYALLHDTHRMRRWRIGTEPELRRLTRPDLLRFYRNFYRPGNTVLSIVGDVDPDRAIALVERLYGGLPDGAVERTPGPAETAGPGFRYLERGGDIAQTQLVLGWRTAPMLHEDTVFLDLLGDVLGSGRASRLYRAVRERKLAASVSAYDYTPTELGVFVVHAETPPATTVGAARAIWEQLRVVREQGVAELELERARRLFESRWVRRFETMEGQANYLAEWEALGDWRLGEAYLERVVTATPAQLQEVAQRYLVPERCGMVVYRPAESPRVAADAAEMMALLEAERPPALPPTPPRAASAPPAAPRVAREREEAGVHVFRAPDGLPILVRRKAGTPLVHMGLYALGGACDEPPELAGLTTLMARTALKGTARRTAAQIAEDGELLGGSVGASVGSESFGWAISVPARNAAAAVELLADVAQHATIPDAALDTERAVAIADVKLMRDDMYRYPMRLFSRAAFEAHPYGQPVLGNEETLPRITAQHVRDWHRRLLHGAPFVAVLVGDVDPEDAARLLARELGEVRHAPPRPLPPPRWPEAPVVSAERREKAQTALVLGFPGPTREDDARYAAELLAGITSGLGGRFFDELRDRQSLAYTVHAVVGERRLAGTFAAYIATSPEKEDTARRGLLAEFAKLREAPVTPEELRRAQTYAIGTHAIRQESGGAVLGDVVDAWLFGRSLAELEEYDARMRAVTPADIQALARRYFDESRIVEGVVRGVARGG